jgi:hypothetical protein
MAEDKRPCLDILYDPLHDRKIKPIVRESGRHHVIRCATRWSKGSSGFRADREVKINL